MQASQTPPMLDLLHVWYFGRVAGAHRHLSLRLLYNNTNKLTKCSCCCCCCCSKVPITNNQLKRQVFLINKRRGEKMMTNESRPRWVWPRSAAAPQQPHKQLSSFVDYSEQTNKHRFQCRASVENIKVVLWPGVRGAESMKCDRIAAEHSTHSCRNLAGILQWCCGRWQEDKVWLGRRIICPLCETALFSPSNCWVIVFPRMSEF